MAGAVLENPALKKAVLKIEELWLSYTPPLCPCGDKTTVEDRCADCFWEEHSASRRRGRIVMHAWALGDDPLNYVNKEGYLRCGCAGDTCCYTGLQAAKDSLRYRCNGCAKLFFVRELLSVHGQDMCEGCWQAQCEEEAERAEAVAAERRPCDDDGAEDKANRYYKTPLHCCGDGDCEGDCEEHYCGCKGRCVCDDDFDPLAGWDPMESGW